MSRTVDASGLSCPQPVLLTLKAIRQVGSGEITVLVDTAVSRENVSRMATSQGWQVQRIREHEGGYRITIVGA